VNWFLRVNEVSVKNARLIEQVEKDWFGSIKELKDRLTDEDYKIRRDNMKVVRHAALNGSNDSRVVSLYQKV